LFLPLFTYTPPLLLPTFRHDKDIDSFLNDFEENAASMTLHPTSHSNSTTTTTTTNTNATIPIIPNPTTNITTSSGGSNVMNTIANTNAACVATVGSTGAVGLVPATVCVNSIDDEDGTDAFMDELEDLIK